MHLKYDYHLSYVEAERLLGVKQPPTRLALERLRWTGHMLRSKDTVLFEAATFIPPGGLRGRGWPRRRFSKTIKVDLKDQDIVINSNVDNFWANLKPIAANRSEWSQIMKGDARMDS